MTQGFLHKLLRAKKASADPSNSLWVLTTDYVQARHYPAIGGLIYAVMGKFIIFGGPPALILYSPTTSQNRRGCRTCMSWCLARAWAAEQRYSNLGPGCRTQELTNCVILGFFRPQNFTQRSRCVHAMSLICLNPF